MIAIPAPQPRLSRSAPSSSPSSSMDVGRPWRKWAQVFWSPERLFQSLRERPDWLSPFLLVSLLGVLLSLATAPYSLRAALASLPASLPAEQFAALQRQIAFGQKLGLILTPVLLLLRTLLGALVLTLLRIGLAGRGDFRQSLAILSYLALPLSLSGLANLLVLRLRGLDRIEGLLDLQTPFGLNLLFPGHGPAIDAALGLLNPFDLWYLALLILAVRIVGPCPRPLATGIGAIYWLLAAMLQIGSAVLMNDAGLGGR